MVPKKDNDRKRTQIHLSSLTAQLADLTKLTTAQLRAKYAELFGKPSQTNNAEFLRRQIARKIQEQAEGGLSKRADEKIIQLGEVLPAGWRKALSKKEQAAIEDLTARDPRLPAPGTKLPPRVYKGKAHTVTVRHHDFEYEGKIYKSLSAVARTITGSSVNGFEFFGLDKRSK